MANGNDITLVNKKWRTLSFLLAALICCNLMINYFNRAKFDPQSYTGWPVQASTTLTYYDDDYLIVMLNDPLPHMTESISAEIEGDTLKVYFRARSAFFLQLPFGKVRTTYSPRGYGGHVFAIHITEDINSIIDMRQDEILWERHTDVGSPSE